MEALSWIINIFSTVGWIVQIKRRKQAMIIFTLATILSIVYFWITWQLPFLLRSFLYLGIDIVTLWEIQKAESRAK